MNTPTVKECREAAFEIRLTVSECNHTEWSEPAAWLFYEEMYRQFPQSIIIRTLSSFRREGRRLTLAGAIEKAKTLDHYSGMQA